MDHRQDGEKVQRTVERGFARLKDVNIQQWSHEHHHNEGEEIEDQDEGLPVGGREDINGYSIQLIVRRNLTEDKQLRVCSAVCLHS